SANVTIGGTQANESNTISGNITAGVYFSGTKSSGGLVVGNRIGTDPSGAKAVVRNGGATPLNDLQKTGVSIVNASGVTVGGAVQEARNIISGNYVGVMIANANGNDVAGNYIGTNATGLAPLGNIVGIYLNSAGGNQIGGSQSGEGNTVS